MLSVCLTPDGHWVMSGSKDRGVQFWDPITGNAQMMLQGHKNSGKRCASFTSNVKLPAYKGLKSSPLLPVLPIIFSQPAAAICAQESGGKHTMALIPF